MKKIILLATTLCLLLAGLAGCDDVPYTLVEVSFHATILEIHDGSVTVQTNREMGFHHTTRVFFGTSELEDIGASVGDVVNVVYTGDILQTYPEQVFAISWSLVEKGNLYTSYDIAVGEDEAEVRWAAVPAVFANDTWFRIFDDRQQIIPSIDDTWINLGRIQSAVQGWESPTQNFQSNDEGLVGAYIYHSPQAGIRVINNAWGEPMDTEVMGEAIIVTLNGRNIMYITEESQSKVLDVMNEATRHSLMIDGILYSLMATASGGSFSITENHILIGEVADSVEHISYPTENLQANRDALVGARIYRLPSGSHDDIVVFFNVGTRFYFSNLSLAVTH